MKIHIQISIIYKRKSIVILQAFARNIRQAEDKENPQTHWEFYYFLMLFFLWFANVVVVVETNKIRVSETEKENQKVSSLFVKRK